MAQVAPQLEESRRLPKLAMVEWCFFVGRRRPLSELPEEKQAEIRKAYEGTEWASDYAVQFLQVYTDLDVAAAVAAQFPGGFVVELGVNGHATAEEQPFPLQLFPNSAAHAMYEQQSRNFLCANACDKLEVERLIEQAREHVSELKQLKQEVARAASAASVIST